MKHTVKSLRESLYTMIRRIGEQPERYARDPGKDFTRKRPLTPTVLIYLILTTVMLLCSLVLMVALFLMLWAAVALVQWKRLFTNTTTNITWR